MKTVYVLITNTGEETFGDIWSVSAPIHHFLT